MPLFCIIYIYTLLILAPRYFLSNKRKRPTPFGETARENCTSTRGSGVSTDCDLTSLHPAFRIIIRRHGGSPACFSSDRRRRFATFLRVVVVFALVGRFHRALVVTQWLLLSPGQRSRRADDRSCQKSALSRISTLWSENFQIRIGGQATFHGLLVLKLGCVSCVRPTFAKSKRRLFGFCVERFFQFVTRKRAART